MTDPQSNEELTPEIEPESTTAKDAAPAPEGAAEGLAEATAGIESGDVPGGEAPIPSISPDEGSADARVAMLEIELADMKDRMLRAVAEQENVRRRAQKDIDSARNRVLKNVAGDLLAVADNLRRALDSVAEGARKETPAIENLMIGVEMTERELMTAFGRHGITAINPLGLPFDPNFHEAMFEYEDASQPAGTVGQVIETGYVINGMPLRAAKVGVTRGGPKKGGGGEAELAGDPGAASGVKGNSDAEPGSRIDEQL